MKVRAVPIEEITKIGKWRAALYIHLDNEIKSEKFSLVPLRDLVIESKSGVNPSRVGSGGFFYIGLENVQSITGEPQGITLLSKEQVHSRSKVFTKGNILYGRLRPYLRKVLFVELPFTKGLCSTEFIVLKVNTESILPLFLREVLVSDSITDVVTRFQSGAALPRISSKDLLSILIPVPPLEFQEECVLRIEQSRESRRELLAKIELLAKDGQNIISEVFK